MSNSSSNLRVGFVGLGAMGTPMTRRLVEAGVSVTGFDVSKEARSRCEEFGVRSVQRLEDVTRAANFLILMLPDSEAVESVLTRTPMLAELSAECVVIDMSSSEPLRTRSIAEQLALSGVRMIDAPVSGGVRGAVDGTLTVMVGGDVDVLERARAILEVFGKVIRVGDAGAGHAVKALNNLMSATHLLVTSEAMLTGTRFGLDPQVMLSVFNGSSGRSGSTENKWPNYILPETFDSGFGLRLMLKDMKIAVQLAAEVDVPCDLGVEAVELWSAAAASLAPSADHTEIADWLRKQRMEVDE